MEKNLVQEVQLTLPYKILFVYRHAFLTYDCVWVPLVSKTDFELSRVIESKHFL